MPDVESMLAWGAGAGVFAGLAYARWGPGVRTKQGLMLFLVLGMFCTGLFLFYMYLGDPESRRARSLGFTGPLFIVGSVVARVAGPFVRKRKPPR